MDDVKAQNERVNFYSPFQIFSASFLGGPIAGGIYLARSLRFLGKNKEADWAIKVGFGLVFLFGFCIWYVPENVPNFLIPLLYSLAFEIYIAQLLKQMNTNVKSLAPHKGSTWKMIGMSLVIMVATLVVWIVIFLILDALGILPDFPMQEGTIVENMTEGTVEYR